MDENPYAPPTGESAPESESNRQQLNTLEVLSFSWVGTGVLAAIVLGAVTWSVIPMLGGFVLTIVLNTPAFAAIAVVAGLAGRLLNRPLPNDIVAAACGAVSALAVSSCLFDWFDSRLIASTKEHIAVSVVTLLGAGWNTAFVRFIDGYWYIES